MQTVQLLIAGPANAISTMVRDRESSTIHHEAAAKRLARPHPLPGICLTYPLTMSYTRTPEHRAARSKQMEAQWRERFREKKRTLKRFDADTVAMVKQLRGRRSLAQIAEATGISIGYVNDIACGRARKDDAGPDPPNVKRLLKYLELDLKVLQLQKVGDWAGAAAVARKIVELFAPT